MTSSWQSLHWKSRSTSVPFVCVSWNKGCTLNHGDQFPKSRSINAGHSFLWKWVTSRSWFLWLSYMLIPSSDAGIDDAIGNRLGKGKAGAAFGRPNKRLWGDHGIRLSTKIAVELSCSQLCCMAVIHGTLYRRPILRTLFISFSNSKQCAQLAGRIPQFTAALYQV